MQESFIHEKMRKMKDKATKLKSKLKQTAKRKLGDKLGNELGQKLGINPTDDPLESKEEEEKADYEVVTDELGRRRTASLLQIPDISVSVASNVDDLYLNPVRIQYFSEVPMSDLECCYPEKTFSLKPMDQLYLAFTVLIGIWAIFKELLVGTDTTYGLFIVMMSVFLMVRSLVWYRTTELNYIRVLNQALAESNVSTDKDTILSLIDSVDEQQFMETVLAYFVLLRNEVNK